MNRILVLEDEESVNRGISFSLEKAGYEVVSCRTMAEAKVQAAKVKAEVVICDINLPDGSGLDFIKWLKQGRTSYVICLTALDEELDQVMGYEAGADDYVTKPFSLSVLLLKIHAFFRRNKEAEEQTIWNSGRLVVHANEMRLLASGEEVALTKNEWKLLLFFLKNPRQILSKQQILEHVLDVEEDYVDENTLAVNIRRLREKIEEDTAKPQYIKNVRGMGYIWNQDVW